MANRGSQKTYKPRKSIEWGDQPEATKKLWQMGKWVYETTRSSSVVYEAFFVVHLFYEMTLNCISVEPTKEYLDMFAKKKLI